MDLDVSGETAIGPVVPVTAEGQLIATLTALWSDVDGVRVSLDYQDGLEDLSGLQARALADTLQEVAGDAAAAEPNWRCARWIGRRLTG